MLYKMNIFQYMVPFEILHKISNPYIDRHVVYQEVKICISLAIISFLMIERI